MRKYILFSIIMAILVTTLIILYLPKKALDEIYIIKESHYVLYDDEKTIGVKYFSKTKNIINKDDIDGGFIYNSDQSIKFMLETIDIKKIHDEHYLDSMYYGYELIFKLPEITDSYFIEDFNIKLTINSNPYEFFVGSLYVEYPEENSKYVDWYGIEGIKEHLPRLSQILVDVHTMVTIDEIYVGPYRSDFFTGLDNIVINLDANMYVFTTTFVKIYTELGVTYLPNFTYFMNYELLSSGMHQNYIIK